jgi:hypothetical protein
VLRVKPSPVLRAKICPVLNRLTLSCPQIVLSAVLTVSQCAVLYSPYYGAYPYAAYPTLAKSTITYKTSGKYPSQVRTTWMV